MPMYTVYDIANKNMEFADSIQSAYVTFVLDNGKRPPSVATFAAQNDMTEKAFYEKYASFSALENDIVFFIFEKTADILKTDEVFDTYSFREKVLAVYFTWIQTLGAYRSFMTFLKEQSMFGCLDQAYLNKTQSAFTSFMGSLVQEGLETGEVADRLFVTGWYKKSFWSLNTFLLHYWLNDSSANFEKTDAAIEKSVNFKLDLIEPNALDSGFDWVKFLLRG